MLRNFLFFCLDKHISKVLCCDLIFCLQKKLVLIQNVSFNMIPEIIFIIFDFFNKKKKKKMLFKPLLFLIININWK